MGNRRKKDLVAELTGLWAVLYRRNFFGHRCIAVSPVSILVFGRVEGYREREILTFRTTSPSRVLNVSLLMFSTATSWSTSSMHFRQWCPRPEAQKHFESTTNSVQSQRHFSRIVGSGQQTGSSHRDLMRERREIWKKCTVDFVAEKQ